MMCLWVAIAGFHCAQEIDGLDFSTGCPLCDIHNYVRVAYHNTSSYTQKYVYFPFLYFSTVI